jgi:hypothetical protein
MTSRVPERGLPGASLEEFLALSNALGLAQVETSRMVVRYERELARLRGEIERLRGEVARIHKAALNGA